MIKLFFITLLCVALFADSQEDQMNEMEVGLRKAGADMVEHAMMGQGSPLLMQRAARGGAGGGGRGRRGGSGGSGGSGGGRGRGGRQGGNGGRQQGGGSGDSQK